MTIFRVFPRRTSATPDDDLVAVNRPPRFYDKADEVHVSVAFTWDIPVAEKLAYQWETVAPVSIGGPAYKDPGDEFRLGLYLKKGYVITSRGCPNNCWFCGAWKHEGRVIRELPIQDGWNLLDNNILACSQTHQERVYRMLMEQPRRPRFTGGLEAARFSEWHLPWFDKMNPESAYFAYDTPDDYEPLVEASRLLRENGLLKNHVYGCYVLIGYPNDTMNNAEERLQRVVDLELMPQAMLYNREEHTVEWKRFARQWANKTIVGSRM